MESQRIKGKIWILADSEGRLIEDIDTDQIFHNAFLHITEIAEMGPYALGNLKGWEDFPQKAGPGDIVAAGRNFGAGSSRQQAVDCFRALGIGAIIAPSFGAIYFRNAVNSGFPVFRWPGLEEAVGQGLLQTFDHIRIESRMGRGHNETRQADFALEPMSEVQAAIFRAGGLFVYAGTLE
jgi:3-isopropylmalate/(R)-2-methylmalate dehydratase small subunit